MCRSLRKGAFAFVAGGSSSSSVTAWSTCGLGSALAPITWSCPRSRSFMKALARRRSQSRGPAYDRRSATTITSILALDPPGIDLFRVARAPTGCSSTASSGTATSFNLGQGSFVPNPVDRLAGRVARLRAGQRSGQRAGVQHRQPDLVRRCPWPVVPSRPGLAHPDGSRLYVAAADGQVHVLDTQNRWRHSADFVPRRSPRHSRPACAMA